MYSEEWHELAGKPICHFCFPTIRRLEERNRPASLPASDGNMEVCFGCQKEQYVKKDSTTGQNICNACSILQQILQRRSGEQSQSQPADRTVEGG